MDIYQTNNTSEHVKLLPQIEILHNDTEFNSLRKHIISLSEHVPIKTSEYTKQKLSELKGETNKHEITVRYFNISPSFNNRIGRRIS